jgi:putative endonuclease
MKGFMYILKCGNGAYYTGSTTDLDLRLQQHQRGEGANFTRKHLPVELVYYEVFDRIDDAFYREKQVQGWRRAKKEALINGHHDKLRELAKSYASAGSASDASAGSETGDVAPELAEGAGSTSSPAATTVPEHAEGTSSVTSACSVSEKTQRNNFNGK